jgi:hypothetical protein
MPDAPQTTRSARTDAQGQHPPSLSKFLVKISGKLSGSSGIDFTTIKGG